MDPSVPNAAAILLEFIYKTETGKAPPDCYEVIFGQKQRYLPKPLTRMTCGEVLAAQVGWAKGGSSAAGALQLMRRTFLGVKSELGLSDSQLFDANLQDRIAYHLLKRRGFESWYRGSINDIEFAKRLAQEWASFPVLVDCQGAHRWIKRGETYYAGDKLNKALITPTQVEALLKRAKGGTYTPPAPTPKPKPTEVVIGGGAVVTGGGGAVAAAQQGHWGLAIVLAIIVAAVVAFIVIRKMRDK